MHLRTPVSCKHQSAPNNEYGCHVEYTARRVWDCIELGGARENCMVPKKQKQSRRLPYSCRVHCPHASTNSLHLTVSPVEVTTPVTLSVPSASVLPEASTQCARDHTPAQKYKFTKKDGRSKKKNPINIDKNHGLDRQHQISMRSSPPDREGRAEAVGILAQDDRVMPAFQSKPKPAY